MKSKIYNIFTLAMLMRIMYWFYQTPFITTDVSYWGLMARDIANFRYFPIWRYGSSSIGALFSYMVSFISPIFKISIFSLTFAELIFSFLFILSTYYVGKSIWGRKGGIVVLLLVSFAPASLIKSAVFPTGVYNIVLFLGNTMFLLALKIWEGRDENLYYYGLLGFVSGISFWVHFYSICFLIPCIIFILFKKHFKAKPCLMFIILFFAGSLPFWFFNLKNNFFTFRDITLKPVEDILYSEVKDIFSLQLNNMLSVNSLFNISGVLCFIYLIGFVSFCYKLNKDLFKLKESIILFFIIFGVAIITKVRVNPALDIHPSIILYAGFPYALAYFLINLKRKSRIIYTTAFLFVIVLQLGGVLIRSNRVNISKNIALNQLVTHLKFNNIHYICTTRDYAPIINFMADASIVADYYDKYENMPYRFVSEIKQQPAFVLPKKMGRQLMRNLRYVCKCYEKIFIDTYVIFYSFKRPIEEGIELSSYNWHAISNYNNEDAGLAFDRDAGTRWTTHTRQRPDMYFQLDLKDEVILSKVIIYLSRNTLDRAKGLKIEVSSDAKDWKEIVYLKNNMDILLWSGPFMLWANYADRQEYYFKPVKARYIKFSQLGFADDNYWSINEMFVYSPSVKADINYDINKISQYLKGQGPKNIFSDYWLNKNAEVGRNIVFSDNNMIVTDRPFGVEDKFDEYNIDYKKDIVGGFFIYHSLISKYPLAPLSKDNWSGSSNIQQFGAELAFDGNLATRWSTEELQSKGCYFQIDIKEEKLIAGVRLWHMGSPNDWPRGIKVEYLDNNSDWKKIECRKDFTDSLYWTGFNIIIDSSRYYTYVFKPVKTKAVRCVLEECDNRYYWSIHEIDLLTPSSK